MMRIIFFMVRYVTAVRCGLRRTWMLPVLVLVVGSALRAAGPVEFVFTVDPVGTNPFLREISAEVALPSGRAVSYPAFYMGDRRYAVRVRAEVEGDYRLGKITEIQEGKDIELVARVRGHAAKRVLTAAVQKRPSVVISPSEPRVFAFTSGERFVPLGANLAWPDGKAVAYYSKAFEAFAANGLNWSRLWMAHWSGLNLDWLPEWLGTSPRGGELDLRVAKTWDKIVQLAEERGIYFQLVMQHHGQYSSQVNSNWEHNPWNVANGGFLHNPVEFFTSAEAIRLTKHKFRYIIARWGYSPAIMSWELFNEVHWTDAVRGDNKDEEAVARWHSMMSDYVRSIDRHGHLVATSTEDLNGALYARLDYFQPHMYAPNLLAGVRSVEPSPATLAKPVFYGEMGDDHLMVDEAVKKSGNTIVPPVWASLMGNTRIPAQAWLGGDLVSKGRVGELGAVAKFIAATDLCRRSGLVPCTMVVACAEKVPLVVEGGYIWHRHPAVEMELPFDGRVPLEFASIPRIYMNREESGTNGYPSHVTYHTKFPEAATLRFKIRDSAVSASAFRFSVDGGTAAESAWPELPKDVQAKGPRPQPDVVASVPAGEHTLVVENPADAGWFDLAGIDFGMPQPALAAIGQRSGEFLALWLWHREGVFAIKPSKPVVGKIVVDDLPAGTWNVSWWDTLAGKVASAKTVRHSGGELILETPPIARHAAVVLEKTGKD